MEKIIKLRVSSTKFKSYKYSNPNNINLILKERNIEFSGKVILGDNVQIDDNVKIGNGAKIGNNVSISKDIVIGALAKIGDNVDLHKGYNVQGSRDSVTYAGDGMLSIGCLTYPIDGWLKSFVMLGKNAGYSDEEIEEYFEYMKEAKEFYEKYYNF